MESIWNVDSSLQVISVPHVNLFPRKPQSQPTDTTQRWSPRKRHRLDNVAQHLTRHIRPKQKQKGKYALQSDQTKRQKRHPGGLIPAFDGGRPRPPRSLRHPNYPGAIMHSVLRARAHEPNPKIEGGWWLVALASDRIKSKTPVGKRRAIQNRNNKVCDLARSGMRSGDWERGRKVSNPFGELSRVLF